MYFKGQKFFVAGMSKSGQSSAEFLLERGAFVYVYDDMQASKIDETIEKLCTLGAVNVTQDNIKACIEDSDILVLSPGIPIDNTLPVTFKKQGKLIIGEEELGALFLRATAIAVTGTNGKTTTVNMLHEILCQCNKNSTMCGNCGTPLVSVVDKLGYDDFAVIEISSFQLETLYSLRPHISIITNISEDHLNRHYNMDNYVYLKSKLVTCLREGQYAVLNYDDERVRAMAGSTRGNVVYFSTKTQVNGAYLQQGIIYYNDKEVMPLNDLNQKALHNVYNALACIAAAGILGLDFERVACALKTFNGVKHRIENICKICGVSYIDDSKGTNIDATIKAVESMTMPTILLLGGKDKGYNYDKLFACLEGGKVVHAILYGENRFKMLDSAVKEGYHTFSMCAHFEDAVHLARIIAKDGQCVLLSPASSSFDEFSCFEERGEAFAKIVESFKND
jgi:UDP-N-acetylmuramoylalanine--D-glutamate ligase